MKILNFLDGLGYFGEEKVSGETCVDDYDADLDVGVRGGD